MHTVNSYYNMRLKYVLLIYCSFGIGGERLYDKRQYFIPHFSWHMSFFKTKDNHIFVIFFTLKQLFILILSIFTVIIHRCSLNFITILMLITDNLTAVHLITPFLYTYNDRVSRMQVPLVACRELAGGWNRLPKVLCVFNIKHNIF